MKSRNFIHLSILITGLTGLGALVSNAEAAHQTQCGVFLGNSCDIPLYTMRLCNQVTLNTAECEKLCEIQKPICNVEDFGPWVDAFQKKGKKGVEGPLVSEGEDFDSNGVLAYTSEKTLSVCRREVAVLRTGSWQKLTTSVCPRAETAGADSCDAGTVYRPATAQCETVDASGGSPGTDYDNLVNRSQMLTAMQNQHFSTNPDIDPNFQISAATTSQIPGLSAPTKPGSLSSENGGVLSFGASAKGTRSSAQGSGMGSAPNSGNLASLGANADENTPTDSPNAALASAKLGSLSEAGEAYGSAGGQGGVTSGSASEAPSWFGKSAGTSAGGPNEELAFKDGKSTASGNASGTEGGATRGLAADGTLKIDDPANYFMLSDIEVSLFKRVTAACRKKEKSLVLSP